MCGIFGQIGNANLARSASDAIRHRGPDDAGHKRIATGIGGISVVLEHRRLSIIDLSPAGHQPMCNADESIWITFNGEVYNFGELRSDLERRGYQFRSKSDTETIVHGYEEWGESV